MTTLTITDNSPEAQRFLEYARTFPFVKETKEEKKRSARPCKYSIEELREHIDRSMEDLREGRFVTDEQLRNEMASW